MNLNVLALRLKNFFHFQKWNFLASYFSCILGRIFPVSKNKIKHFEKIGLLNLKLKKLLYFRRQLAKPQNQKFLLFLFKFFVC